MERNAPDRVTDDEGIAKAIGEESGARDATCQPSESVKVISIEQAENSTMLQDFSIKAKQKYAIVMGNEVKGVQQEVVSASDYCIEIPQFGTKHSLNISVSCGVVLWDLFKQFKY